jgi:TonB-dependent SusC/RagA subfamily outer membrane receptor
MNIPPNHGITSFKRDDIAHIRVLKTPDELAIYGPRGVNGVIVITTKQALGPSRGS